MNGVKCFVKKGMIDTNVVYVLGYPETDWQDMYVFIPDENSFSKCGQGFIKLHKELSAVQIGGFDDEGFQNSWLDAWMYPVELNGPMHLHGLNLSV
jgi:hypothetical protein